MTAVSVVVRHDDGSYRLGLSRLRGRHPRAVERTGATRGARGLTHLRSPDVAGGEITIEEPDGGAVMCARARVGARRQESRWATSTGTPHEPDSPRYSTPAWLSLPVEGKLPSMAGGTGWLNSQPPHQGPDLRGREGRPGSHFGTLYLHQRLRSLPHVSRVARKNGNTRNRTGGHRSSHTGVPIEK